MWLLDKFFGFVLKSAAIFPVIVVVVIIVFILAESAASCRRAMYAEST